MLIVTEDNFCIPEQMDYISEKPVCVLCGCFVDMRYREVHREKCTNG